MKNAIKRAIANAVTVDDMIADLQRISKAGHGDAPVFFQCERPDHWRTMQAIPASDFKTVSSDCLKETANSKSGVELVGDDHEYIDLTSDGEYVDPFLLSLDDLIVVFE